MYDRVTGGAAAAAAERAAKAQANLAHYRAEEARMQALCDAQEAAERRRRAQRVGRMTCDLDPGPVKASWEAEAQRGRAAAVDPPDPPVPAPAAVPELVEPKRVRVGRKRLRPWKAPRRRSSQSSPEGVINFSHDRAWTPERSQSMATRIKKNDACIAHPRAAEASLRKLSLFSQASVRRVLRAMGWTFADESARRHLALWLSWEEFMRPRAWSRPKRFQSKSGMHRFSGFPRYAMCCVGWTQEAFARLMSGPGCTDAGADPIDRKTVARHVALAEAHGGVQVVRRNPDAPPELRGRPCDSNPAGWSINEYWIPTEGMRKPGFVGQFYDAEGNANAVALEEALAIVLSPRAKRARRLREAGQAPPPIDA